MMDVAERGKNPTAMPNFTEGKAILFAEFWFIIGDILKFKANKY